MEKFQVRTDLALEARERFEEDHVEVPGVKIEERYRQETDIRITRVVIETENGSKIMGKPRGVYVTLEAPGMSVPDECPHPKSGSSGSAASYSGPPGHPPPQEPWDGSAPQCPG